ncbi:MAG TPA: hypothetical protein PK728_05745 [Bacillota bacterium]|nr:hypothetical protein [Bacillota bacterium]
MKITYRTIAGLGAAALVFLALTRVGKRLGKEAGECAAEFVGRTRGRVEGVIRRRSGMNFDPADDVI